MSRLDHPFVWLVRRELWENRAILFAPPVIGVFLVLGYIVSLLTALGDGAVPYRDTSGFVLLGTSLVAFSYALDSLHGERRDRTILFWKSLPVSDVATVMSKLVVPVVIAPVVAFAVIVATNLVMLIVAAILAPAAGEGLNVFRVWALTAYTLVATALWYAPLYTWLIFISGVARRMVFIWAAGIPLVLAIAESNVFGTDYISDAIKDRLFGVMSEAFGSSPSGAMDDLRLIDGLGLITSAGLWLGLIAAAALIFAAAYLRRTRQPG